MLHALPPPVIVNATASETDAPPTYPFYFAQAPLKISSAVDRETALLHQAQEVAQALGGSVSAVHPLHAPPRRRFAFFRMTLPDGEFLLKLLRDPSDTAVAAWNEPAKAEYAWHQGWGAEVRQLPEGIHGLLSRYIDAPTLTPEQIANPLIRRAILQNLHAIHEAPVPQLPLPPPDYSVIARERIRLLQEAQFPEFLSIDDLWVRWQYVHDALAAARPQLTYCHGDYHPENIFWQNGRIVVIDWDAAAYSDPLLDLARFAVLSHISSGEVPALLGDYGIIEPNPEQIRHVQLCMAMLNLEFYAHRMKLDPHEASSRMFLAAVLNDTYHIANLPPVSLGEGEPPRWTKEKIRSDRSLP